MGTSGLGEIDATEHRNLSQGAAALRHGLLADELANPHDVSVGVSATDLSSMNSDADTAAHTAKAGLIHSNELRHVSSGRGASDWAEPAGVHFMDVPNHYSYI